MAPEPGHNAQHHGVVVEHVGQQDDPDGVLQVDRRPVQAQQSHEPLVDHPSGAKQSTEGRGHHDGRHHKGDGGQGLGQRLAGKVVVGEDVGTRESHKHR